MPMLNRIFSVGESRQWLHRSFFHAPPLSRQRSWATNGLSQTVIRPRERLLKSPPAKRASKSAASPNATTPANLRQHLWVHDLIENRTARAMCRAAHRLLSVWQRFVVVFTTTIMKSKPGTQWNAYLTIAGTKKYRGLYSGDRKIRMQCLGSRSTAFQVIDATKNQNALPHKTRGPA